LAFVAIAGRLGNGWTTSTADGHLRFFYNNEEMLVVHNETNGKGVWTKELKYLTETLVKHDDTITLRSKRDNRRLQNGNDFVVDVAAVNGWHRLERPAQFNNENRGEYEQMVVEKV
jgi:hypothetical protein